jgi:hypothetical protein
VALHRLVQVLDTLEPDPAEPGRERLAQDPGQLDGDQAQVLERTPAETAPLPGVEVGEGAGEVGERQTAPAPEGQVRGIAQPPAQPGRVRRRQAADGRDQAAQDAADGLLRSRTSSSTIGTTESAMTIATRTWTYRSMLGTARPSR